MSAYMQAVADSARLGREVAARNAAADAAPAPVWAVREVRAN